MDHYQQLSFADAEYAHKGKVTRREKFLDQLNGLLPWQSMMAVIVAHKWSKSTYGQFLSAIIQYRTINNLSSHCIH